MKNNIILSTSELSEALSYIVYINKFPLRNLPPQSIGILTKIKECMEKSACVDETLVEQWIRNQLRKF